MIGPGLVAHGGTVGVCKRFYDSNLLKGKISKDRIEI